MLGFRLNTADVPYPGELDFACLAADGLDDSRRGNLRLTMTEVEGVMSRATGRFDPHVVEFRDIALHRAVLYRDQFLKSTLLGWACRWGRIPLVRR